MARLVLALFLSAACSGCAGRAGRIAPPERTAPSGVVRVLAGFATPAEELMQAGLGGGAGEGRVPPFVVVGDDSLLANPAHTGRGPFLERVEFVDPAGHDPGLLLRLGEVDLAVLYGRSAATLIRRPVPTLHVERAPLWDTVYFLWLDGSRRWVNDPAFRRWLAAAVDREAMLRYLFDDAGVAAGSLSEEPVPVPLDPAGTLPFSRDSRPRLVLLHEERDSAAASIGARLRAALRLGGVELSVRAVEGPPWPGSEVAREADLLLLSQRSSPADSALTIERLAAAESAASPGPSTERDWLRVARLVPLVRLHAWLVRSRSLEGVAPGPYGTLGLERARWSE